MTRFILAGALVLAACASAPSAPTRSPQPASAPGGQVIADGTVLFPGAFLPGRQPDGNSVMLSARDGWIVFDTGRHREHTQRLLAHARASGRPIAAIVNSHWHLDHASGNRLIRDAYPDAPLLASPAVEAALAGFLAESRRQGEDLIARNAIAEPQLSDLRGDIATIAESKALLPSLAIEHGSELAIAGRRTQVGVAAHAVTGGDVWLFDPGTQVLLAGDLVTLPVPLFDTACPTHWQAALSTLDAIDFSQLVPGHGAPMDHAAFARYRRAFDGLLACASGDATVDACSARWLDQVGELVPAAQHPHARALLAYYLPQILRAPPERQARFCPA